MDIDGDLGFLKLRFLISKLEGSSDVYDLVLIFPISDQLKTKRSQICGVEENHMPRQGEIVTMT